MNFRSTAILAACGLVTLVVGSVLFAFDDTPGGGPGGPGDPDNFVLTISLGSDFWCNDSQKCDSGDGMATGKDYCRWSQTNGVEGSCFFCDGSERAAICQQKTSGGGCSMDTQKLAICGFKLDGTCVKDASYPTGAKCKKTGTTTSQQCKIPTCK
jgi:hypothetical protein